MTAAELTRWLKSKGCTFQNAKGHTIVRLGKRLSVMPRHPAKEIKTGTLNAIIKALGLKKE